MAIVLSIALAVVAINYVPSMTQASQSDAAAYDYSSVGFIGTSVPGYDNKYKVAVVGEGFKPSLVNIQTPPFATEVGIYITFPSAEIGDVTVNGKAATYDVQGAGMILHLSNFTETYSDVVISKTNSSDKGELYVYMAGEAVDPETKTETETTPSTIEDGVEMLPAIDKWDEYPANATKSADSVSANIPAYTDGNNWASQMVKNHINLTRNKWYRASVTLKSTVARKFQLIVQNDQNNGATNWDVNNGESVFGVDANETYTFTTVFQAVNNSNPVLFGIMMGYVESASDATTVEVTAASLKQYDSEADAIADNPGEDPGDEPSEMVAPASVAGYNFYAIGKGYQIVFKPGAKSDLTVKPGDEGAVKYNIFVDNSGVLTSFNASDCSLVDKKKGTYSPWDSETDKLAYIDASVFEAYADDSVHNIYIQAEDADGNVSAKSKAGKVRISSAAVSAKPATDPTDISRVYVVTNDATSLDSFNGDTKEESKQDASLTIISGDGTIKSANHYGTIKLRGNSTAFADKKAYNISFNDKKEVINGAPKGKKWCLLANAYEKTLIRNKLAMDFGLKLGGVATPMESYTDVYINGVYKGTFVISEPADNERAGVEYNEDGNDLLFELENNDRDESNVGAAYVRPSKSGYRFVTEDMEDDVLALYEQGATNQNAIAAALSTNEKYTSFKNTLNDFETALYNAGSNDYTNYIDVDSFVDMYVINELFQVVDFGYSSVKFYITYDESSNPTIHAGPLWDFDLATGNSGDAGARTYNTLRGQEVNPWFRELMKRDDFASKVKAKYQKMQGYIQNLYKDNALGTNEIDKNVSRIEASRIRNYKSATNGGAGWSESTADGAEFSVYRYSYSTIDPYNTYTYSQHIEYLRSWLKNRNEYLVQTWGLSLDWETDDGVVISDDLDITGYQISTNYGSESGSIGQRTVYQAEPTVEGSAPVEVGLVYGIGINGDLSNTDMVVNSNNAYVTSQAATEKGSLNRKMGDSATANYYAMTMVNNTNVTPQLYTTKYFVRAYAKLADGSYAYSTVKSYTVFRVADYLYQNNLINTLSSYNYIYEKILHYVDPTYVPGDFEWSNTIIKNI